MYALLAVAVIGLLAGAPPDDRHAVLVPAAPADDTRLAWPVVDELGDGAVLDVTVSDGAPGAIGTVAQCATTCWNRFPVRFDTDGTARFLYPLVATATCTAGASCVVRVTVGDREAVVITVFGGPAPPPPDVARHPSGPLQPGDRVTVTVVGLPAGAPARASFCAERCAGITTADADRSGRATLVVDVGARCDGCEIVVVAGSARTVLPVSFVPPPAPRYDPRRLVVGLAIAAALLLTAWRLIATTDWRPPSEAAVPDPPDPI